MSTDVTTQEETTQEEVAGKRGVSVESAPVGELESLGDHIRLVQQDDTYLPILEWDGRQVEVTGAWSLRWLYLSVDYALWLDDERIDRSGGPRLHPELLAELEKKGHVDEIRVSITSIVGLKPDAILYVNGEAVASGIIRVENRLHPLMILLMIASLCVIIYLGPAVWSQYVG